MIEPGIPEGFSRGALEVAGYVGWRSWNEIRASGYTELPRAPGCYVVYRPTDAAPRFLAANPGGRFKGKDPTVAEARMIDEWTPTAHVVYIGKANDLHVRLKAYARFGNGEPVAHWGGRLIWQLADADDLQVAWCTVEEPGEARELERRLLARFAAQYSGRRPLANLTN